MKIKNLSKLLAFGVLLNSVPINSFAGVLSEDGRYETFSGNDITINDILEENKVDMKIEGDTLVNCLSESTYISHKDKILFDKASNTFTFNKDFIINEGNGNFRVNFGNSLVEAGKTYTLIFNIIENTLSRDNDDYVAKFNLVSYNRGNYHVSANDIGIQKVVLQQPDETTHNAKPYLEIFNSVIGSLVIKDIMILEGD